jgi:MFS family permease
MERSRQNWILALMTMAGFVATFMGSSINIALKSIEEQFHVSAVTLGWIPLFYALAAGAVLMPVGRIADLFGRNRVYLIGLVGFTVASFASAAAPSATVLLIFRVLHGLFASLLFATNFAIVTLAIPPESRGKALGVLTGGVYLGTTLGPVLGGVITQNAGWRALFLFIGALSLVNTIPAFWMLRGIEWHEPKTAPFDVKGALAWAIALPLLLLGFSYLPGTLGVVLVAAGLLGFVLFFWFETRAADPLLSVDLLRRNRVFAFSNAAAFINYSATAAMTFIMSLYLQYNRGLDPQHAGYVLVTGVFLQAMLSLLVGRLADRVNPRLLATAGMALTVLGLAALVFLTEATSYWYIVLTLCVLGVGFALFAPPIAHTVMGSVEKRQIGTASATLAAMRVAGQTISIGLATMVLAIVVGQHEIDPAVDKPHLLTSVRLTFVIFAVLCVFGVAASLVGPRKEAGTVEAEEQPPTPAV